MGDRQYLPEVKDQYENYPYPPRDPEQERERLIDGIIDHAALVNHYCFGGKQSFENARVLIAGGGTGDATMFWAEQLRDKNAEVVHVDISEASIQIAQQRAAIRELENITWHQQSLLDLSSKELGYFDFVNCHGVLHHLADPTAGLRSLHALLRDNGGMGLLLYGRYGRLALYQVQELLQRFGIQQLDIGKRVELARRLMEQLPASSWYKRSSHKDAHVALSDAVFFDSYLHSQDRAYTVSELYDFIATCEFHFVEFCNPAQRVFYRPETYLKEKQLLQLLPKDQQQRQAAAELLGGHIDRHEFYISRQPDTVASLDDLENVPFFFPLPMDGVSAVIAAASDGKAVDIDRQNGLRARFKPRQHTEAIFKFLDGMRTLAQIFAQVRQQPNSSQVTDEELLADFRPIYNVLNRLDVLLLRHQSVNAFPTGSELHARTVRISPRIA
jgi:SAM-dependent methyltransferase